MTGTTEQPLPCRVYWGHSGCDLPRGHDFWEPLRTHHQTEPSEQSVTAEDALLFGEDLTEAERATVARLWL